MRKCVRVAVYCGSSDRVCSRYKEIGKKLGALLAEHGIDVVYGGSRSGIMGSVANAVLEGGGQVIGVMPQGRIDLDLAHKYLTELRVVKDMRERQALITTLSDAFVVLPGGFGTLEELFDVLTWKQLGLHHKPVVVCNSDGFYDAILSWRLRACDDGFLADGDMNLCKVVSEPGELVVFLTEACSMLGWEKAAE